LKKASKDSGPTKISKGLKSPTAPKAPKAPKVPKSKNASTAQKGPSEIVELQFENLQGNPKESGRVRIELFPEWAPKGVARFQELTRAGFWDECRIFRVLPRFIVQFGINGTPAVNQQVTPIDDDPVVTSNVRGTVVFATAGADTRTTQMFINTGDNTFLDDEGFAPIGRVVEGMDVVDACFSGYGEGPPSGTTGPDQELISSIGNSYLEENFPLLTFISKGSFI
jgi:peptidyl-prolyl cis-trans isomerase A (cyclophilin A)